MSDVVEDSARANSVPVDPGEPRLLADGCLGGILAAYLLLFYPVLQHPNPYNFLFIPYLPVALFLGAVVGALNGGVLGLVQYLLARKLGFLLRVVLGTAFFSFGYASLIGAFDGVGRMRESFAPLLIVGLLLSVPTALFAASKVNPCSVIVRGFRIRTREAKGFPLLSGAALRILSICALMISVFCFACVWPELREPDTSIFVVVMLYFAVSTGTAYACPRRSIALLVGLLTNASLFVIILRPSNDSGLIAAIFLIYCVLWAAFIVGRSYVNKQIIAPPLNYLPTVS